MGNGMNKVLPGLYVGNFRDSKDQEQLNKHHITHILSIHDNARKLPCNSDKEYLCIIASDSPGQNLTQFFTVCNDFIHTARLKGGNILIHCLAGMSRSVTVAVVYVMCVTSLSWRDALKAVQGARNVANPNIGFLKQLQEFEKERLHDERRRIKDKFPDGSLTEEDEQTAKELLTSYYHYMSVGEMCDGNCHQGVVCPRGLCNQSRSSGIFRRNSKEASSNSRSTSPLRRQASSPCNMNISPKASPETSRNPSPTSSPNPQRISSNTLTPPVSPYHPRKAPLSSTESLPNCPTAPDSPSRTKRAYNSSYGQPTPPGSPSRSYGYYTSSPARSPASSPSGSIKNNNTFSGSIPGSPNRSFRQGKIIHCPSTPPASPARSCRNRNHNLTKLPPFSSTLRLGRNKNKCETSSIRNLNQNDLSSSVLEENLQDINIKRSVKANWKNNLLPISPHKKLSRLRNRDTKSLDLVSPPGTPLESRSPISSPQKSILTSPVKRCLKPPLESQGSPSRFCQAVTRLLPQIVSLNNSSKLCKNNSKSSSGKLESALYVDEKGRSSLKPKTDGTSSSSSTISSTDSGSSLNPSLTFDEDETTRLVIFEVCKNIQKLPKECDDDYESERKSNGNNLSLEKKVSVSTTTIDISSYKNSGNTNIIINPIFSLENKYESESLCNNKSVVKYNDKQNSYSAFLDNDMIYVETTEIENNDYVQKGGKELSFSHSNPVFTSSQINKNDHRSTETKKSYNTSKNLTGFSKEKYATVKSINETISKEKKESHFRKLSSETAEVNKSSNISNLDSKTGVNLAGQKNNHTHGNNTKGTTSIPMIHAGRKAHTNFSKKSSRPPHVSSPPPVPPRKVISHSAGQPSVPPPVPPRNMKPQAVSDKNICDKPSEVFVSTGQAAGVPAQTKPLLTSSQCVVIDSLKSDTPCSQDETWVSHCNSQRKDSTSSLKEKVFVLKQTLEPMKKA